MNSCRRKKIVQNKANYTYRYIFLIQYIYIFYKKEVLSIKLLMSKQSLVKHNPQPPLWSRGRIIFTHFLGIFVLTMKLGQIDRIKVFLLYLFYFQRLELKLQDG